MRTCYSPLCRISYKYILFNKLIDVRNHVVSTKVKLLSILFKVFVKDLICFLYTSIKLTSKVESF